MNTRILSVAQLNGLTSIQAQLFLDRCNAMQTALENIAANPDNVFAHEAEVRLTTARDLARNILKVNANFNGPAKPVKPVKKCSAVIHHGAGHQTKTHCQRTGPHRIHEARYGRDEQVAMWRGKDVCSGFFNEPPEFKA